jgi:hypothetical protein
MAKVKGTALISRCSWVVSNHGKSAFEKVLQQLADQEQATELRRGALQHRWYPFELYIDLNRCIDRVCGKGDGALYRKIAGSVALNDLNTVYRLFFRFANRTLLLRQADTLFRQYNDSGHLMVHKIAQGHIQLELRDFETPHQIHCESLAGWLHRCAEMTGAKDVKVEHTSCRAAGAAQCHFEVTWA